MLKKKLDHSIGLYDKNFPNKIDWENQPSWMKKRIEWFKDQKLGVFIHFGLYTQGEVRESWPLSTEDTWAREDDKIFRENFSEDLEKYRTWYRNLQSKFNPYRFNPDEWADLNDKLNSKYMCVTTRHHDGFALYDSMYTDFKITNKQNPYGKDLIKILYNKLRERKIGISTYYSPADWNKDFYWDKGKKIIDRYWNYDENKDKQLWNLYSEYVYNQLEELSTNYGKFDMIWLDSNWLHKGIGPKVEKYASINMDKIGSMLRKNQENLLIIDRGAGGKWENIETPEGILVEEFRNGNPWEASFLISDHWSFIPGDKVKTIDWILHKLLTTWSFGGNAILNIPPTKEGDFTLEIWNRVKEVGTWIKKYSNEIFGTREIEPYKIGDSTFLTSSKDKKIINIFVSKNDADKGLVSIPKMMRNYKKVTYVDGKIIKINPENVKISKWVYDYDYAVIKLWF